MFSSMLRSEDGYDPFARGPFPVGVSTIQAFDAERNRMFPCEVWYPAGGSGSHPLVVFSHSSGGGRRQSTFLCEHLSSHGYFVAAQDHSEVVAAELARKSGESSDERAARMEAWMANRVRDVRFLLDDLLRGEAEDTGGRVDASRVGIAGHSLGGWTALAMPETEERIGAVVAMAPAGASRPKPGMIPAKLNFEWRRRVPTLYLAAESDVSMALSGIEELFERTPPPKYLFVVRKADHMHFMDDVERRHEAVRAMPFQGELAWVPKEMRPITELRSAEEAHYWIRGLTVCHMDAALKGKQSAQWFLASELG